MEKRHTTLVLQCFSLGNIYVTTKRTTFYKKNKDFSDKTGGAHLPWPLQKINLFDTNPYTIYTYGNHCSISTKKLSTILNFMHVYSQRTTVFTPGSHKNIFVPYTHKQKLQPPQGGCNIHTLICQVENTICIDEGTSSQINKYAHTLPSVTSTSGSFSQINQKSRLV